MSILRMDALSVYPDVVSCDVIVFKYIPEVTLMLSLINNQVLIMNEIPIKSIPVLRSVQFSDVVA